MKKADFQRVTVAETEELRRILAGLGAEFHVVKNRILKLAAGEREVSSAMIGNLVMEELLALDQVAYIRFASVYLDFTDVNAFRDAIEKIEKTKAIKKKR